MGNELAFEREEDPTGVPQNFSENTNRFPIHRAAYLNNGTLHYFINNVVEKYPEEAVEALKRRCVIISSAPCPFPFAAV